MVKERKYIVMNSNEYTQEMEEFIGRGKEGLKSSPNRTKILVKWFGDIPSCFDGFAVIDNDQAKKEIEKDSWKNA